MIEFLLTIKFIKEFEADFYKLVDIVSLEKKDNVNCSCIEILVQCI
jgi:hypothetical protein